MPYVGKVIVDDVWSGGTAKEASGKGYLLMSDCIRDLYHPNCKDSHTTYFEGISTPPGDNKYAVDELDDVAEN